MKNNILMNNDEPSDVELLELMHEVGLEAKHKALLAQKKLAEKIKEEINDALLRQKAKTAI